MLEGSQRDRLLELAAGLDIELGYEWPPETEVPGEQTRGEADGSVLSESDERLVAAVRAGLARLANGAARRHGDGDARLAGVLPALDGAEAVMRGEILCGQTGRLPGLVPDFVFLVTLPVVGKEEAMRLAARTRELLDLDAKNNRMWEGSFVSRADPISSRGEDCVLFDLDGVLVDSRRAITGCINHALVAHDLPARPPEELYAFIGPSLGSAFAELTGQTQQSAVVVSCLASYRARYSEVSLLETSVISGIEIALGELARRYRLAVATSKPLAFAEPLLTALGLRIFFAAVAGSDLSVQGQSKARTIAVALEMLGHPERAVMVGDRSFDIAGAHSHSLCSIGVTWGMGSAKELQDAGAESIVQSPAELTDAVDGSFADQPDEGLGRGLERPNA